MNTKPRAIVMMISVAMAAMSMSANAVSYAEQMAGF